jgi:hypothetical protein
MSRTSLWTRVHVLSAFLSHVLKLRSHLDDTRIVIISALCLYVFILSRFVDMVVCIVSLQPPASKKKKVKFKMRFDTELFFTLPS